MLISMAGEGAVLIAEDGQVFDKPAPKGHLVNAVGAGDSMVAGFMAGWMDKQDYEHASVWVLHQEVPVHFLNIWLQRAKLKQFINK